MAASLPISVGVKPVPPGAVAFSQPKASTTSIRLPLQFMVIGLLALFIGAGWLLVQPDIPVLVRNGLLEPLGDDVAQNSRKYFAAIEIMALAANREWLSDATQVVSQNWNIKNANRKKLVAA